MVQIIEKHSAIELFLGANFKQEFQWLTVETDGTETPIDITGKNFRMDIRESIESNDAIFSASTDTGEITITNASEGKFEVDIDHTVTENTDINFSSNNFSTIPSKFFFFDIEVENTDSSVEKLVMGYIKIYPEITR